jgi:hypothetical protein
LIVVISGKNLAREEEKEESVQQVFSWLLRKMVDEYKNLEIINKYFS